MKTKSRGETSIKPGEVLLTEKPFSYVLKAKLRSERCDTCFKRYVKYIP